MGGQGILDQNLLRLVTFLPFGIAVALLATAALARTVDREGLPDAVWRGLGLAGSGITFLISLLLFTRFDATNPGMQFVEYGTWLPEYGINYFVGLDGISLFLVLLTRFLMPIVLLASWTDIGNRVKSYIFFMLFLETGMLGAFVSLNVFQFYVFWEVMLIPMYFIIGIWGGPRRIYAAVKFFLFTMFGSLLMLVAILVLYSMGLEQFGVLNLDLISPPGLEAKALLDVVVPTCTLGLEEPFDTGPAPPQATKMGHVSIATNRPEVKRLKFSPMPGPFRHMVLIPCIIY